MRYYFQQSKTKLAEAVAKAIRSRRSWVIPTNGGKYCVVKTKISVQNLKGVSGGRKIETTYERKAGFRVRKKSILVLNTRPLKAIC